MRVAVFYNLRTHSWSIECREGSQYGRVIGHSDYVQLNNAYAVVRPAGRKKVLEQKRKNVHAFIVGDLVRTTKPYLGIGWNARVRYNPYESDTFMYADTDRPFTETVSVAHMNTDRRVYVL